MSVKPFQDIAVIYHSSEDGCWIAHSLRTDQVGTGVDMGRALADLIRGVDSIIKMATEDSSLAYLREAGNDVKALAAKSKPLPAEIYEVAHRIARGTWPNEIDPGFTASDDQAFTAEINEEVPC